MQLNRVICISFLDFKIISAPYMFYMSCLCMSYSISWQCNGLKDVIISTVLGKHVLI